jgi:hypothetical protein
MARRAARRATPAGKCHVGRSRTPLRCTGTSSGRLIAATPAVVPQPSHATAEDESAAGSAWAESASCRNIRYAPITTRLDTSGMIAGQAKRCCAWSTPDSTIPMPYRTSCGAKTTSRWAPRSTCALARSWSTGEPISRETIGRANTATRTAVGIRAASAQVRSADAIRSMSARNPRASGPASSGTTTLASAPPATISNNTFGTRFAVLYTDPVLVAPTLKDWTNQRAKPATRLATVIPATSAAAPARPVSARVRVTPGVPSGRSRAGRASTRSRW